MVCAFCCLPASGRDVLSHHTQSQQRYDCCNGNVGVKPYRQALSIIIIIYFVGIAAMRIAIISLPEMWRPPADGVLRTPTGPCSCV